MRLEILFFVCCCCCTVDALKYTFSVLKGKTASTAFEQASLMKTLEVNSHMRCLGHCDGLVDCLSVTYDERKQCSLYNDTISNATAQTGDDATASLRYKQLSTLSQSCVRTECDHMKLLYCFDNVCLCDPARVESTWCAEQLRCARPPRTVNSACTWHCECDATQLLHCAGSQCVCDTTTIYNTWCPANTRCARTPASLAAVCDFDCECRAELGLVCSSAQCKCNFASVNNTWCAPQSTCARPPRTISSPCVWSCECDATKLLICSGGACICDSTSVFNTWCPAETRCVRSVGSFGAVCDYNCECNNLQGLVCSGIGGQCICNPGSTLNTWCSAQGTCARTPATINGACNWDCECRSVENLFCVNSICNCRNSSFEWKGTLCDWIEITTYMWADAQTSWGSWGGEQRCPNREPAVGFQLLVEGSQGGSDDTALNGIQLICQSGALITSSIGGWGGWNAWNNCPAGTYLDGFQFRSESPTGGDDTAGNDLYMRCSDGTVLTNTGGMGWGSWGAWFTCTIGHVCGITTQVEGGQGGGDDTSLNSVSFTCCFP